MSVCKLSHIMNKLQDNQILSVYVGSKNLYTGKANKLYKNIDERYYDIDIDTLGTDIVTIDNKRYLALLVYYSEYKELPGGGKE